MSEFRDRLIAEAKTWEGTPFAWQQATKGRGCDCKGLIAGIARELSLPESQSAEALMVGDYKGRVPCRELKRGLERLFDKVDEPQPGDVLLMRFKGKAQHLGMYLGEGRIIHCHQRMRNPCVRIEPVRWGDVSSVWSWREGNLPGSDTDPHQGHESGQGSLPPPVSTPEAEGLTPASL